MAAGEELAHRETEQKTAHLPGPGWFIHWSRRFVAALSGPAVKGLVERLTAVRNREPPWFPCPQVRYASHDRSKPETHDAILPDESAGCDDLAEDWGDSIELPRRPQQPIERFNILQCDVLAEVEIKNYIQSPLQPDPQLFLKSR